ncbi:hypothetical protein MKEN_01214000 [Mycena kentingensis (nom. inval.)]|nr:hypothetical protein MKEN_01214000 [Mycena kentingensis (nom. inval.)]
MISLHGFSAWITVNGQPLPEYLVAEDSTAGRVSCWIPSEPGVHFLVHWKDAGSRVDTAGYISLDGLLVPGRFLMGAGETFRAGVRVSATTERPFMFRKLDSDETATSGIPHKDVGMVTLKIKRIKKGDGRSPNAPLQHIPTMIGQRRAGDVSVGFGEERATYLQSKLTWAVSPYQEPGSAPADPNTKKSPSTYVSFVFRYRTLDWLRQQGIAPADDRRVSNALVPQPSNNTPMTPRESPDPSGLGTPPKKKHKPGLEGKAGSPSQRPSPRRPSSTTQRSASYHSVAYHNASRQASMEHVFHFSNPVGGGDDADFKDEP